MADQSPRDSQIAAQATLLNEALDAVDAALTKLGPDPLLEEAAALLAAPVRALAKAAKE